MAVIYLVAGARPNFMKIAPIVRAPPAAVLVVGDVNSTLACSIVARKLNIPFSHVEAGLRSGDMTMPEEINRLVTDSISDWFFVTEPAALGHLRREGKDEAAIHYVGHVMVDNVLFQAGKLAGVDTSGFETAAFKAARKERGERYGAISLHRPSNVDHAGTFARIAGALREFSAELQLIFPVHPRTRNNLEKFGIDLGPKVLAGTDPQVILAEARNVLRGEGKTGKRPHLWDGKAAERIVAVLAQTLAR